ncbi:MAG: hypothetical protein WA949_16345 [Phormidesmis sp.]
MSSPEAAWFIIKNSTGYCEILSEQTLAQESDLPPQSDQLESKQSESEQSESEQSETETLQQWGPFATQNQAIAKRVGLIRAGKCRPAS